MPACRSLFLCMYAERKVWRRTVPFAMSTSLHPPILQRPSLVAIRCTQHVFRYCFANLLFSLKWFNVNLDNFAGMLYASARTIHVLTTPAQSVASHLVTCRLVIIYLLLSPKHFSFFYFKIPFSLEQFDSIHMMLEVFSQHLISYSSYNMSLILKLFPSHTFTSTCLSRTN